jgi:hypothetical protein
MKEATLRVSDVMLLVGTRVALGIGVGLLVARRLDDRARKAAGVALVAVGALTTVPIVLNLRASSRGALRRQTAPDVAAAAP